MDVRNFFWMQLSDQAPHQSVSFAISPNDPCRVHVIDRAEHRADWDAFFADFLSDESQPLREAMLEDALRWAVQRAERRVMMEKLAIECSAITG